MAFYQQLGVEPGITAVIGSGGKTSLLGRLAEEVPGTVILCTTTHIRPFPAYPLLTEPTPEIVRQVLANSRVLCLGTPLSLIHIFHDLRHTFATLSLKSGVDVKTLSGALGHYSAGFTLNLSLIHLYPRQPPCGQPPQNPQ